MNGRKKYFLGFLLRRWRDENGLGDDERRTERSRGGGLLGRMGSEVAASSAQSKRADKGGGSKTGAVEGTGGSGRLSSSSSCVCVLLSTVTVGTGGGGLIGVGVGSLTVVYSSLVDVLVVTKVGVFV